MLPAWQLRELSGDKVKMSDTLNSLGTLRQRQRQYAEAETHYARSLEVRRALGEGKEKWQLVAQSLVSLGNLLSEIGDSKPAGGVVAQQCLEQKPLPPPAEEGGNGEGREGKGSHTEVRKEVRKEGRSCTLLTKEELYLHALEVPEDATL